MKTEPIEALKEIKHCTWTAEDFNIRDGLESYEVIDEDDAINIANIAFREGQSSPKIKQLEWILESGGWHISMTQFGVSYEIGESKNDGNFILYDILLTTTIHDTIDEAKAAAQAHFEKKVKECLDL